MTYSIHDAHRDGRHDSTHPEAAAWEFEGPDPEVGIFGDSVVHTCDGNVEEVQQATVSNVNFRTSEDGRTVTGTTTFTCPVCSATTATAEVWPASMFSEPGR